MLTRGILTTLIAVVALSLVSRAQEPDQAVSTTAQKGTEGMPQLQAKLASLLPKAPSVPAKQDSYLWLQLKLYVKDQLDGAAKRIGMPQPFFSDLSGTTAISSASTPFKVIGDELTIAQGATITLTKGQRFFFLDGTWHSLTRAGKEIDECLAEMQALDKARVHTHTRQAPQGVYYSQISGTLYVTPAVRRQRPD